MNTPDRAELLDQARSRIQQLQQEAQQQHEADRICVESRLACVQLLTGHGQVRKDVPVRVGTITGAGVFFPMGLPLVVVADILSRRFDHRTVFETFDSNEWHTSLNGVEPVVNTYLSADHPIPQYAHRINVAVEGLDHFISLTRTEGKIYNINAFSHKTSYNPIRRANLEDAKKWQEFISSLS